MKILLWHILDISKKTNVLPWFRYFLSFTQTNRSEVIKYQQKRLKSLFIHSASSVPYYKKIFIERNNSCWQDSPPMEILKTLPVLDRNIIQQQKQDLISTDFYTENLVRGSSSGTTGIPINYYADKNGFSAGVAAGYVLWSMSNWKFGQRNVHIWGNQSSIERWNTFNSKAKNLLINQKNIASTLINDPNHIKEVAEGIIRFNPVSIEGYASSIYSLANYFKNEKVKLRALKQVLTTAENLEDYQKDLIEEVFAPVGDLYGSGEVLGIATCPAADDKYYIFDPHVILETIDSGIPGMKDILLTDLDNYGMPLIRYKIGDMIDCLHDPEPDAKYPFSWFTKIQGRSSDVITLPNGLKFHPVNIFGGTLFRKFQGITRHKVVWDGSTLEFIFEAKDFNDIEALRTALTDLLKPYEVNYTIQFTEKIETSEVGKYKYMEIVDKKDSSK